MFNIQFNFDPETSKITNLQVVKINKPTDVMVTVEDNKLKFSKEALELLGLKAEDRVCINYYTESPELTFPIIGTPDVFKTGDGNRITKSNTVSYRGSQRDILLQYGKFFKLEPFKKYYKMISIDELSENDDLMEEEQDLQNLE